MSQAIEIHADVIEESDGTVVIKTHDTIFRLPTDCVVGIAPSENPLCKYTHTVTLNDTAQIAAFEALSTSRNILSNIFHSLPADRAKNNNADCDCITVCDFCICTPQDCDCDCF